LLPVTGTNEPSAKLSEFPYFIAPIHKILAMLDKQLRHSKCPPMDYSKGNPNTFCPEQDLLGAVFMVPNKHWEFLEKDEAEGEQWLQKTNQA